jgi:magnesium chelatase family protein
MVTKYQKRKSGPLFDRIDMHNEVPRVDYEKLSGDRMGETSDSIHGRAQAAEIFNKNALPVRSPTSSVMPITQRKCAIG